MTELKLVLMNRKGLTSDEADELINEMKNRINNGESSEEIMFEYNIDPIYAMDLNY